jgi:hypothetical protein
MQNFYFFNFIKKMFEYIRVSEFPIVSMIGASIEDRDRIRALYFTIYKNNIHQLNPSFYSYMYDYMKGMNAENEDSFRAHNTKLLDISDIVVFYIADYESRKSLRKLIRYAREKNLKIMYIDEFQSYHTRHEDVEMVIEQHNEKKTSVNALKKYKILKFFLKKIKFI